ncbi:MAG TPA: tubulin-like doman-containing protein [Thermoanaerobaculia bacterium]|nr:tubulin-like doman-containing protein [Thermoanaerobaculia bacterium]
MPRHHKVVIEEMLTKPSAVCPTLFVGLGGCGCRMVTRVAEHLRRRPDYEERYRPLVKFALVDTNVNDLESFREKADATFLISDFEKEEYADLASGKLFLEADPYFTQWVPQNYRFRAGDTAGAGQIRIESRLGVFYQMKHKDFVPKFRKLLEDLKSHEHGHRRLDSSEIRIVICYSVAGGTGSGSHLPIAYMLRDQASELGKPMVVGVAVLPAVFEDKTGINKDGTFANGYAALKETEYLMRLGAPDSRFFPEEGLEFHYDPSNLSKRLVRQRPFEFLYVIDKPQSFTVPDPVEAAADGLYLQFFSPLFGFQASDYDNYTQHQRFLVPHDFEAKGIIGFTSFYGSYGTAVLLVPVDGLVEYCAQAAALSLMRASFLRAIPGEPVYDVLRNAPEPFYEVTLSDGKNEKPVHVSDFQKKEADQQERLQDRLYMKRVRLLARYELDEGEARRFLTLFRHGHRVGEVPTGGGGWELDAKRVKADQEQLARNGMRFSIAGIVLPAVSADRGSSEGVQEMAGLLAQARQAMEAHIQQNPPTSTGASRVFELKNRATTWLDELKSIGMRILKNGYKLGTVEYPGMDALVELDFLNEQAGAVDLAAKRYAILSILERVRWDQKLSDERITEFSADDHADGDKIVAKDVPTLLGKLQSQATDWAMQEVTRLFLDRLSDFQKNLQKFVRLQRDLERTFDQLEGEQLNHLRRLRESGGRSSSANQYVLDAEALQIEDGRRMWDFYFEDRIADLPELSLENRDIQVHLSNTITEMSIRRGGGTSGDLDKLFTTLRQHVEGFLFSRINGDPHSPDRERRDGLTLSDALELEVVYRAIYRSNTPEVDKEGHKVIRELVSRYRHLPPEEQIDLKEDRYKDYLRDKIKRLVKEKASLLCVYEEGRDQHGGVRPDNVFVAAIDEDFKSGTIETAIRSADPNLTWLTTGWNNPKEIVFYRAVLNVPLYVFGRMKEMKSEYERFRNLAKRPKVLHIDHNWENSLPDLDPDSAQENHRQELLRSHVINFASLLTTPHPGGRASFIVRHGGKYCLVDPVQEERPGNGAPVEDELTVLGETLAESIQRLPEVLESEMVKYLPYQQMLRAVRDGLAPEVLSQVVQLPFQWRKNHDELRNKYGSNRTPTQQEKLKDYSDAYQRLREALDELYDKLSNFSVEQRTLGEDIGFNSANLSQEEAQRSLDQSLKILATFTEVWSALEDPDRPGAVSRSFQDLFRPLDEKKLTVLLERLRNNPIRPQKTGHEAAGRDHDGQPSPEASAIPPMSPAVTAPAPPAATLDDAPAGS